MMLVRLSANLINCMQEKGSSQKRLFWILDDDFWFLEWMSHEFLCLYLEKKKKKNETFNLNTPN